METLVRHEVTDPFLQRLEEPLVLFGQQRPAWMWVAIVIAIVAVGLFYVGWMYLRERRTIGWFWPIPLGLFRISVYALLGLLFLLPSRQHYDITRTERSARVVLLFDTSLSMKEARDGFPEEGGAFKDIPSRQEKVLDFLSDDRIKFIDRLETKGRPVAAWRFAAQLDPDYRWIQRNSEGKALHFWPSAEAEWARRLVPQKGGQQPTPGYPLAREHWQSWLFPDPQIPLPADWNEREGPGKELVRQLAANKKATIKFFEGTALGEALLDTIRREQGGQVQGIVVFTDGRRTEGSDKSIKDAVLAAKANEIPIFVVGVGKEIPKVSIDIVDLRVPPLIRPEDKFRVVVTVNGHDMPVNEPFELFLDITRKGEGKDKKEFTRPIELVALDEKGNLIEDKKVTLKKPGATTDTITLLASKHSKDTWLKKEQKPTFKPGNPPNAQIEFELDAATLAKMAGFSLGEDFQKAGLFPDDTTELHFRARIPKDKRELTDIKEHLSDVEKMAVQKRPLRVLLFTSTGGIRDFQFVQNLLVREESKGRAEVCAHVQQIPGGEKRSGIVLSVDKERLLDDFPTKRKASAGEKDRYMALSSYDVIIAFDPDWTQLSKEQLKMISEWVEKDGGGLIFVAGDMNTLELARPVPRGAKPDSHPLLYIRDMLPVVLEDSRKTDQETEERRRLLFPQATAEMEFMRLDESDSKFDWKKGWDRFFNEIHDVDDDGKDKVVEVVMPPAPPERGFYTYYPARAVKQNALVIASFDSPGATLPNSADKQPFLARAPWGEGTAFWIASGETWQLRMFREAYHERFWTKLIREVGSKSINVVNKRIVPVMSRYGVVNKPTTFEGRFEDLNGQPLRRDLSRPPVLIATLPQGAEPKKGDLVLIKDGEYTGETGRVVDVKPEPDGKGGTIRNLRVAGMKGDAAATTMVDARKVEMVIPPIKFKPRLGTKPSLDLDRKNDGWFKVEFVPPTAGEYKLRVQYEDAPDNFYNHKFTAREEVSAELENLKPDVPAMLEMASSATQVLARITDEKLREEVRNALKAPAAVAPKAGEPARKGASSDERLKLYFEIDGNGTGANPKYIPDCMMTLRPIEQRKKGDLESLWDKSVVFGWNKDTDRKAWFVPVPLEVSLVDGNDFSVGWRIPVALLAVLVLLSMEWLIRKLLRLA